MPDLKIHILNQYSATYIYQGNKLYILNPDQTATYFQEKKQSDLDLHCLIMIISKYILYVYARSSQHV